MANNETIADIIAEKRRQADKIERDCAEKMKRGEMVSDCYARALVADIRREADRLETAMNRERAKIEADALEVGGIVEAARREVPGNAAAMREALTKIFNLTNSLDEDCAVDPVDIRNIAKAVLAEPVRNCDRLDVDDAFEAFTFICDATDCRDCPYKQHNKFGDKELCAMLFLYDNGNGGKKGDAK